MSATNPGIVERFVLPATGVKKHSELTLGSISTQEASAVAITGGSITDTTLAGKIQTITAAGAISLDAGHVKITGPASSTYAVTLAAPSRGGQVLVIEMTATTETNAVTLALANVVGGTQAASASFDAAAETLVLVSNTAKWVVLKEQGVTLSA